MSEGFRIGRRDAANVIRSNASTRWPSIPRVRRVNEAMTGIESGLAEVDGGKLAWESAGEGPDVVFLHPGLWDSRVWD